MAARAAYDQPDIELTQAEIAAEIRKQQEYADLASHAQWQGRAHDEQIDRERDIVEAERSLLGFQVVRKARSRKRGADAPAGVTPEKDAVARDERTDRELTDTERRSNRLRKRPVGVGRALGQELEEAAGDNRSGISDLPRASADGQPAEPARGGEDNRASENNEERSRQEPRQGQGSRTNPFSVLQPGGAGWDEWEANEQNPKQQNDPAGPRAAEEGTRRAFREEEPERRAHKMAPLAADKEAGILRRLEQLASLGEITTKADMAREFGVRPEQIQELVERVGANLPVAWHTMRGQFGTLLYPASTPLVEVLHKNWHRLRRDNEGLRAKVDSLRKELHDAQQAARGKVLEKSAKVVNELLRNEVQRRRAINYKSPQQRGFEIQNFNLEEEIKKTNPQLLQFFLNLSLNETAVAAQRKGERGGEAGGQPTSGVQDNYDTERRRLRVLYAINVLIFAINPEAKHPFHLLLADVVEALGGRLTLLRVLNQLGVCAGKDTLNRYTENVGSAIMAEGPFAQLPPSCDGSFIICSIDNADKTAIRALRRFDKTVPDMHVVTCQIHCKPSIKLHPSGNPLTTPQDTLQPEIDELELGGTTPKASGSTEEKVNLRARTLTEGKEPGGASSGTTEFSLPGDPWNNNRPGGYQGFFTDLVDAGVTAERVLGLTAQETAAAERFSEEMFGLIVERERTATLGVPRRALQDDLARSPTVPSGSGKARGDQQTWKYMDDLKMEHTELFSWVLHMPGDWHTLLNAQPVIKKIFFHAGLEEMATKFGYVEGSVKGTLEESSNFRRNNWFIVESWEGGQRTLFLVFLKEKNYDIDSPTLDEILADPSRVFGDRTCEAFNGTDEEAERKEAELQWRIQATLDKAGADNMRELWQEYLSGVLSVGSDEGHEMGINLELKEEVLGAPPTAESLPLKTNTLNLRTRGVKNFRKQI
ncbi:hypothetical protein KFL_014970010, partial [Klebsormidium nitens]